MKIQRSGHQSEISIRMASLLIILLISGIGSAAADNGSPTKSDMEKAETALVSYFDLLAHERYEEGAQLYGGTYKTLIDWNPLVKPHDHAALFKNGCEHNGLYCHPVHEIVSREKVGETEYRFDVHFLWENGPDLMGFREDESESPNNEWYFNVFRSSNGKWLVKQTPPYRE